MVIGDKEFVAECVWKHFLHSGDQQRWCCHGGEEGALDFEERRGKFLPFCKQDWKMRREDATSCVTGCVPECDDKLFIFDGFNAVGDVFESR